MQYLELRLEEILPRQNSQRQKPAGVEALADSIIRLGLLQPIVVDENNTLVAGGNRLEAYKLLQKTYGDAWGKIPCIRKSTLSEDNSKLIELEENVKRTDLSWQERALAYNSLAELLTKCYPDETVDKLAARVGLAIAHFQVYRKVGRALLAGHERVKVAPNLQAADNILSRERNRKADNEFNELFSLITSDEEDEELDPELPLQSDDLDLPKTCLPKATAKEVTPIKPNPKKVVLNLDFIEWVKSYSGPKFNLIHCDFPYGINHGKSAMGGTKSGWDAYEDSPDVYYSLLKSLLIYRDNIMLPSCHIIFWLSARFDYEVETRRMINTLAPELSVDEYALIWHKTDNKGIIRDVQHTPRHIYEKALFITRGDRQIIKAIGDVYGAPTRKTDATHISEKPVPVLRHFFQLFVDEYTELLDPTCGGGSALRAAASMGAKRVLGIELNPEYAEGAQTEYDQQLAIEKLRKQ